MEPAEASAGDGHHHEAADDEEEVDARFAEAEPVGQQHVPAGILSLDRHRVERDDGHRGHATQGLDRFYLLAFHPLSWVTAGRGKQG